MTHNFIAFAQESCTLTLQTMKLQGSMICLSFEMALTRHQSVSLQWLTTEVMRNHKWSKGLNIFLNYHLSRLNNELFHHTAKAVCCWVSDKIKLATTILHSDIHYFGSEHNYALWRRIRRHVSSQHPLLLRKMRDRGQGHWKELHKCILKNVFVNLFF